MDFFSSDIFLTALARDYYQAKTFKIQNYKINDRCVRLAELNGKRPAVSGPFYDYVKSTSHCIDAMQTVDFIPKLVTHTIVLDDREPLATAPKTTQEPAPLVRWERFGTWEEYATFLQRRSNSLLSKQNKRLQRLVTEYGEPTFTFHDQNPEAFDQCISWKIQQYQGGHEILENPRALGMLRGLFNEGHLVMSTLKVGEKYVSLQAGFPWQGQYLALIPAFDPFFAKFGIGKELLHRLLEHCYHLGYKEFDFLQGGDAYKWTYATHLQIIEFAGNPSSDYKIKIKIRNLLTETLRRISPTLFYKLKHKFLTIRKRF